VQLCVVGAHLSGLPLNHQLKDAGGSLVWSGKTAPQYRLYALPNTTPAKPGLKRVAEGGVSIEVEVWELSATAFGEFVAAVPPPLCIGTITLENGRRVKGFLCEPVALDGAEDISAHGGWRAYLRRDQ
jgi:allophanate hydrolase